MTNLRELYFRWMCDKVLDSDHSINDYGKLLKFLNSQEFTYVLDLDGNRYEDGISLRYHFGYENRIDQVYISSELDRYPCSIFEMMVSLSIRVESMITDNPDMIPFWFWKMISSLHLENQNDLEFDRSYVRKICNRFLERDYERDGDYSLFKINDPPFDMRGVEIWTQAMYYINEVLEGEEVL